MASVVFVALLAFATVLLRAPASYGQQVGQDVQTIPVGKGAPGHDCIGPGANNIVDSTRVGDDTGGNLSMPIGSGPNGICDSTAVGDDVYLNGYTTGGGRPFQSVIRAGDTSTPGGNNGICDKITVAGGDDVVEAAAGKSTPRQVGIHPGPNAAINSSAAGDDVVSSVICPGSNSTFDSTPAGDDSIQASDIRCLRAGCAGQTCIVPGLDDILQTTVVADDVAKSYISTSADGILNTSAAGDDVIPSSIYSQPPGTPGGGTISATCVNSGANGIAETSLCGTGGTPDIGEACDTAGDSATCDSDCTLVSCGDGHTNGAAGEQCDPGGGTPVNTPTCDSNCTFVACGDGTTNGAAGEQCDDGNVLSNDGCNSTCQTEFCGDGITQSGLGETCDTGGSSPSCDGDCTAVACGDGFTNGTVGETCDDGNLTSNDGCNSLCQLEFCGDGIIQTGIGEQCDNAGANSNTTPDACRTNCKLPSCGDGVVDPSNTEQCDDGNTKNNDDCLVTLGCLSAVCGDGVKHTKGTPPFEECDDGNVANNDGCDSNCELEPAPGCRNGIIDTLCTAGTIGAACTQNSDCDVSLGDGVCTTEECDDGNNSDKDDCLRNCVLSSCGDGFVKTRGTPPFEGCDDGNTQGGDGCSATCVDECGNASIDGACSEGTIGAYCQTNGDCDVSPNDGVCVTEECDPGIDGLCSVAPPTCSDECTLASCGNGVTECDEQCDLAGLNGVPGSGCTATCTRNVIGSRELTGNAECPGAWTLDNPPEDTSSRFQHCTDGAACDFDGSADGKCTFSVGICLNRPVPNCQDSPIIAADLLGMRTDRPVPAAAAEVLTDALALLTSETAEVPGRCSDGLRRKNCSTPTDCDTFLGAHDGICNVATGVAYVSPLDELNQTTACTPGQSVEIPAGENLRLKLYARRDRSVRSDKDVMRLFCQ